MSDTIENRIVEMQFDNQQFERNVQVSIDTLERLKNSLNIKNVGQSLDGLTEASRNVDLDHLATAADDVRVRFSALQVMGVTALSNIANSALSAGKNLINMFAIEPRTTGFQEYELKMGSVQTIMSSTGASIEEVNGYLGALNEYSDKTIYSFSDMTNSIGKFTNAGVNLDDAVAAIKGISNEAAVSGANAAEASRAMYNFAQALSAGYVKLIDWKSIENANMATVEFKQELMNTAVASGTLKENLDGTYETMKGTAMSATLNFNDSLQDQWMTSEVLVETLKRYASETTEIGKKAYSSAQDVKTFSMMMDTLKEAAQSGWAETWELLVGDLEEAKMVFTDLSNFFGDLIGNVANGRNTFMRKVFAPWRELTEIINDAGIETEAFNTGLSETISRHGYDVEQLTEEYGSLGRAIESGAIPASYVNETLKNISNIQMSQLGQEIVNIKDEFKKLDEVSDQVLNGDFGEGDAIMKKLTSAGYDYETVMDVVNEKLETGTFNFDNFSEAQLEALGYTQEDIESMRDFRTSLLNAESPLNELIGRLNEPGGRMLLVTTLKNGLEALNKILNTLRDAFKEAFNIDDYAEEFRSFLTALSNFSEKLIISDEQAEKLKNTFRALFAIVRVVVNVVGGVLSGAFRVLSSVLSPILSILGNVSITIGDLLVRFADFISSSDAIARIFDFLSSVITAIANGLAFAIGWIGRFVASVRDLPIVQQFIQNAANAISNLSSIVKSVMAGFAEGFENGLNKISHVLSVIMQAIRELATGELSKKTERDMANTGLSYITSIISGLSKGALQLIGSLAAIAQSMIDKVREVLGIHSPSTEGEEIGENYILGIWVGLKNVVGKIYDFITNIASNMIARLKNMNWGQIYTAGLGAGLIYVAAKMLKVATAISGPFDAISDTIGKFNKKLGPILRQTKKVTKNFAKVLNSIAFSIKIQALTEMAKGLAIAIAILVGCVMLLTIPDADKMSSALSTLAKVAIGFVAMTGVLLLMSKAVGKFKISKGDIVLIAAAMIATAAAILTLAKAMSMVISAGMGWGDIGKFGVLLLEFVVVAGVMALIGKKLKTVDIFEIATFMKDITADILLFAVVLKIIDKIASSYNPSVVASFLGGFVVFSVLMAAISKMSSRWAGMLTFGVGLGLIIADLGLMALVVKALSFMDADSILPGLVFLSTFAKIIIGLALISRLAGQNISKFGSGMIKLSVSLGLLAGVTWLLSQLNEGALGNAIGFLVGFGVAVALILGTAWAADKQLPAVDKFLLHMGATMLMLGGVGLLMSTIKQPKILPLAALMVAMAAIVAGFALLANHLRKNGSTEDMANIGKTLTGIGVAMIAMALVVKITSGINDPRAMWRGVGAVTVLAILVGGLTYVASLLKNDSKKIVGSLLAMSVAIGIIGGIAVLLGMVPFELMGKGLHAVGLISLMLAILMGASYFATDSIKTILAMTVAVGLLAGLVALMSSNLFDTDKVKGVAYSIAAVVASLALFAGLSKLAKDSSKSILAMTVPLIAMGAVLYFLSKNDVKNSIGAGVALSVLALSLALTMAILSKVKALDGRTIASMIGVAAGMLVLAASLRVLAGFKWDDLKGGILGLAAAMAILLLGSAVLSIPALSAGVGLLVLALVGFSAALVIASVGIWIISKALQNVAPILPLIGAGFEALGRGIAGFVTTIASSSSSILEFLGVMSALGTSVLGVLAKAALGMVLAGIGAVALGAGAVVAAIGIALLAAALYLMAVVLSSGMEMIVGTAINLAAAAKEAGVNLVAGFVEGISQGIATVIEACTNFVTSVIGTICNLLGIHSPSTVFKRIGGYLLDGFVDGIMGNLFKAEDATSDMADSAVDGVLEGDSVAKAEQAGESTAEKFVNGIKNGIAEYAPLLKGAGSDAAEAVADGATDSSNGFRFDLSALPEELRSKVEAVAPDFTNGGFDLMSFLGTGISDGSSIPMDQLKTMLTSTTGTLEDFDVDYKQAGIDLATGFGDGIREKAWYAVKMAQEMAKLALEKARKELDSHSPSRKFKKLGGYSAEGFAIGIKNESYMAENASRDMAKSVLDSASGMMDSLQSLSSGNALQPVIRPVFDDSSLAYKTYDLSANIDTRIGGPVNSLASVVADAQYAINSSNMEVISAINRLRDDMVEFYSADDKEISLYVDSKKLASSLASPMNRQLNILSKRGAYV